MNLAKSVSAIILCIALGSCSSATREKQLNEKVSSEKPLEKPADFQAAASDVVNTAPGLTDTQRAQLLKVREDMTAERDELRNEAFKLRTVLLKDIVSSTEHVEEIKLIKSRLRQIEDKRMDILFDAIDRANAVLGKFAAQHEKELEETLRLDREGKGL